MVTGMLIQYGLRATYPKANSIIHFLLYRTILNQSMNSTINVLSSLLNYQNNFSYINNVQRHQVFHSLLQERRALGEARRQRGSKPYLSRARDGKLETRLVCRRPNSHQIIPRQCRCKSQCGINSIKAKLKLRKLVHI